MTVIDIATAKAPGSAVTPGSTAALNPEENPMAATTVLVDPAIDSNKLMLEDIDTSAGPLFSVSEMAKVFFARSSHWVRWLETCDYPIEYTVSVPNRRYGKKEGEPQTVTKVRTKPCGLNPHQHNKKKAKEHRDHWRLLFDGELLEPIRTDSNARKYDLALIEKMAHALAANRTIKGTQLRQVLTIVRVQAEMHDYLIPGA